jgi:5-deoxy-glucuronate isomerase
VHLSGHRNGFGPGLTEIARPGDADGAGIGLAVLRLAAGERLELTPAHETAWLLMDGAIEVEIDGRRREFSRRSLFDEGPSAVHVSASQRLALRARDEVELTRYESANAKPFAPAIYGPSDVREDQRGKGLVHDAAHRIVRTIFDRENADPSAELVLGEVITLPGRWSSYPPHHHAQPEIYHYRFTSPSGYGHAELGEEVLKVRHNDTIKIFHPNDHAQCAAPGYGMYYSWVIRHLPERPYTAPEFTEEHRWILDPAAKTWWPKS